MVTTAESLLDQTLGRPLLAFLCNAGQDEIARRLDQGISLLSGGEDVMGQLGALISDLHQRFSTLDEIRFSLEELGVPTGSGGTSLGLRLRALAGGDDLSGLAAEYGCGDDLTRYLCALAINAYPALLLPASNTALNLARVPARVFWDVTDGESYDLLRADPILERLHTFEQSDQRLGRRGYYYTNLGNGGGTAESMIPSTVISHAWRVATMNSASPTIEDFLRSVNQAVVTLRSAVAKEPAAVPVRIFLDGITLGDRQISVGGGILRAPRASENARVPPWMQHPEGVSSASDVVFECEIPFEIDITADGEPYGPNQPMRSSPLGSLVENLCLASLLADVGDGGVLRWSWTWVDNPLAHGAQISGTASGPGLGDCDGIEP